MSDFKIDAFSKNTICFFSFIYLFYFFEKIQISYFLFRIKAEAKLYYLIIEAVFQTCSVKKVFLEMSQHSQENTCARASLLKKLQA